MQPFVEAVDAFHERTAANDWLEGLVKAYVGEGIAQDFYREIANYVDEDTKALVLAVLEDQGQADFAVSAVRQAINEDGGLPDGSPCGDAASSVRRSRRPSGSASNGMHWPACWSEPRAAVARTSPSSAGCSSGSPTSTPSAWSGSDCPRESSTLLGRERSRRRDRGAVANPRTRPAGRVLTEPQYRRGSVITQAAGTSGRKA